jgi:pyruvate formate lyase activating enzyme
MGVGAVAAMSTGLVFNLQRFSLHDGPGVRTTVFLKGCPLHCPWCHNPESLARRPEVAVTAERCLACGACTDACPRDGGPLPAGAALGEEGCLTCGACVAACPSGAREIVGREWTAAEVVAAVLRDRPFFDLSGGGVTFSGGEPLAQPEFLGACLERCRAEGLHTAVDTSGCAAPEVLLRAARQADLVLYDLKLTDPAAHRDLVGIPQEPILDNLRALAAGGFRIWLRLPVVPGVTDSPERVAEAARLAAGLPGVERVSLLPYHRLGDGKRHRLGHERAFEAPALPEARLAELARIVSEAGVRVEIGG